MTFICPKCGRYGMEWDGRAKVLVCYYNRCNHVISIENYKAVPTALEIENAIKEEPRNQSLELSNRAIGLQSRD